MTDIQPKHAYSIREGISYAQKMVGLANKKDSGFNIFRGYNRGKELVNKLAAKAYFRAYQKAVKNLLKGLSAEEVTEFVRNQENSYMMTTKEADKALVRGEIIYLKTVLITDQTFPKYKEDE